MRTRYLVWKCIVAACWFFATYEIARAQSGATISIKPVLPRTNPPSEYPPGTTINGEQIILGSVPARVWLEIFVTGWAPHNLRILQVTIAATDPEGDGGGYSGSNADCLGSPPDEAGNLSPAMQSCGTCSDDPAQECASSSDCNEANSTCQSNRFICHANLVGAETCAIGGPAPCVANGAFGPLTYFPAGSFCEPYYQNQCAPSWIGNGGLYSAILDYGLNVRFAIAFNTSNFGTDYHPSYFGTLIIDVPADAKGTYTIDFDEINSFMSDEDYNDVPIDFFIPAKITIPCGRCCYWGKGKESSCVDHVSANDCARFDMSVFQANAHCPQDGGAACPACAVDAHCDDGVFCNGAELCDENGKCQAGQSPCQPNEKCKEKSQSCKKHDRRPDHK